jgi:hypothetical protein
MDLYGSRDSTVQRDWDGIGPLLGIFAAYERALPAGRLWFARAGFTYQNLGDLDGSVTVVNNTCTYTESGPPHNAAGQRLGTDLSGVHVVVGLGVAFGSRRH